MSNEKQVYMQFDACANCNLPRARHTQHRDNGPPHCPPSRFDEPLCMKAVPGSTGSAMCAYSKDHDGDCSWQGLVDEEAAELAHIDRLIAEIRAGITDDRLRCELKLIAGYRCVSIRDLDDMR